MRRFIGFALVAAFATAAGAQPSTPQPAPSGPPPGPPPATGSAAPLGSNVATPVPVDAGSGSAEIPTWLLGVQDVTAEEMATPGKLVLTMSRAVELAEKQHPTIRVARADAEAAEGRVDAAKVAEMPTFSVLGSLTAGSMQQQCFASGSNFSTCPATSFTSNFTTSNYAVGVSLRGTWTIYDFGLTHANVKAAEANAEAAAASVSSTGLDVRVAVETAYLQAVAYRRLVVVAQATVKSEIGHVDQAKRFVAAGSKDPIEVAQAEATLANTQSAEAQAESNEAVALANLRAAIGWGDPSRQPAVDPNWPTPPDAQPGDLNAYVETARKHRPDLVALEKDITAAEDSISAAHAEWRPTLAATGSVGWQGQRDNWGEGPSWTAGLSLSVPLWDGGRSSADVRTANADLVAAQAQRDSLLVSLTSSIELYRTQILTSKASVASSNEAVRAAQEELKLAEARYAQGLGSQIELADAETAVTTASGNLINAEYQLASAWANLVRAVANS